MRSPPGRARARGGGVVPGCARRAQRRLLDRPCRRRGARARGPAPRCPARLRREHRRDARDGRDHRPGPLRHPADAGDDGAAARPPRGARLAAAAAGRRLRAAAHPPQRRHDGLLHLGHHRRARRLRRHLRRDRPARRPRRGHGRRARADRRSACSSGACSRASCRCSSTAAASRQWPDEEDDARYVDGDISPSTHRARGGCAPALRSRAPSPSPLSFSSWYCWRARSGSCWAPWRWS